MAAWAISDSVLNFPLRHASELPGGFASPGFLNAWTGTNTRPDTPICVTPLLLQAVQECPPVVHRLRHWPRLRSRLTLSGRALPRKPWAFGGPDSHWPFRYSYRHSHFRKLQQSLRSTFFAGGTLPYQMAFAKSAASVSSLSPVYYRCRTPRPVSCYALFKCWLLLSPHPGCFRSPTSFPT